MKKVQTNIDNFFSGKLQFKRCTSWLLVITFVVFSSLVVVDAEETSFTGSNNSAQTAITGEWLADFSRKNQDEIQFTTTRRSERGGQNNTSDGILLSELQGLTREQAFGARTDVNFRIVREAGTFVCEGFFRAGKGAGHWTLTPNQGFVSAMRSRGYDNLTEDNLYSAARFDITTKSIDDLKSAGYDRLSFKELVEANIFDVTPEFIREMKSAGFENLTLKQLVEARIFKVDSQFVKEVEAMGFGRQPLKTLVEMRIFNINPEFISRMRSIGFENLSYRELMDLSVHSVTPEFVNAIKAEGFSSISPRQAVELKIHGVDGEFIRRVKAKGYADVTLRQLVNLRIHDIVK
ncbi:MAG TPA: hypothetical protein VF648_07170 [Pyrinomonadaceae bacterium]|jgi:hypothetical protein